MLKNDISNISSNEFAFLVHFFSMPNIRLTTEFIKENGGKYSMGNSHLNISGTSLELIRIINYMKDLNDGFTLSNLYRNPLGTIDEVLEELTKKNRNVQIDELIC